MKSLMCASDYEIEILPFSYYVDRYRARNCPQHLPGKMNGFVS
jgi:hypothetical protein